MLRIYSSMHLYLENEYQINAWNAVDVAVDGQLQHGHVVNTADNGLIVDLHCTSQTAVFVEYGKIFDPRGASHYIPGRSINQGTAIHALLQARPDRAWTWYHGRMVRSDFRYGGYAWVEVSVEGITVTELLSLSQIRVPSSHDKLQGRVIERDEFVACTGRLPDGYSSVVTPLFLALFQRQCTWLNTRRVYPVTFLSDSFLYLQRQGEDYSEFLEKSFCDVQDRILFHRARGEAYPEEDLILRRKQIESPVMWGSTPPSSRIPLPTELLLEIFHSLDTLDQQRYRRTCQLWDALLTSVDFSKTIQLSYNKPYFPSWVSGITRYILLVCLLKQLGPATQRIYIRDAGGFRRPFEIIHSILLVADVVKWRQHPVQQLIFGYCVFSEMQSMERFFNAKSDIYTNFLAPCCKSVVWRHCTVSSRCQPPATILWSKTITITNHKT
ncbi:uncharacterized protein LOC129597701 [Paramacrobiotus metropolitanus]|uniref:uncharacterized protein LOC129597701 n=1 Tax=Paramacrobiotus metropolitanus TaxID=2943436 RepID=UPI0024465903|nr:uncharacterized protein LOC129597701 [Paramacrobiotus metropolitanus]